VRFTTASGDKETRCKPISAQCEAGNVKLVRAPWNDSFTRELEGFPVSKHDDQCDALSGAHEVLCASSGAIHSANDLFTSNIGCDWSQARAPLPWRHLFFGKK
jgi:Terminase RNaseH-like domain